MTKVRLRTLIAKECVLAGTCLRPHLDESAHKQCAWFVDVYGGVGVMSRCRHCWSLGATGGLLQGRDQAMGIEEGMDCVMVMRYLKLYRSWVLVVRIMRLSCDFGSSTGYDTFHGCHNQLFCPLQIQNCHSTIANPCSHTPPPLGTLHPITAPHHIPSQHYTITPCQPPCPIPHPHNTRTPTFPPLSHALTPLPGPMLATCTQVSGPLMSVVMGNLGSVSPLKDLAL